MVAPAEIATPGHGTDRQRLSLREIHGIVFGTIDKPTHVIVPGFVDSHPEHFAAWIDDLRADGWNITLTPALSFEGTLVDARHVAPR